MSQRSQGFWYLTLVVAIALAAIAPLAAAPLPAPTGKIDCPPPVLSRLRRHKIAPGETLASLAQRYNLLPQTLIQFNPILRGGSAPVGQEILIPPLNGMRVEVPRGATWQDVAKAYGVRADVLFELNGCQSPGKVAFIPAAGARAAQPPRNADYTGLKGYPLPFLAQIGLKYGWQTNPATQQSYFHSGIDLLAPPGTTVLAAEAGRVAFAGQERAYGYLVVVDRGGGWQTRYAHLSRVQVKTGQSVVVGEVLGLVGTTGQPDIPQPHLHFEVRYQLPAGWVAQDPEIHLPRK